MHRPKTNLWKILPFLLISVFIFATTLYGILHLYSPIVSTEDDWQSYIPFYTEVIKGNNWQMWFAQHNEHRIIFTRMLFWIGYNYFHGSLAFQIAMVFVLQCISAGTFLYIISTLPSLSKTLKIILSLSSISFLFCWVQSENFLWGFQTQFMAVYTFALLSLLFFSKFVSSHKKKFAGWSILFALMSSISLSNGIFIWVVIIFLSILSDIPKKAKIIIIALGATLLFVFIFTFKKPAQHNDPIDNILHHTFTWIEYVLCFLSSQLLVVRQFLEFHSYNMAWFKFCAMLLSSIGCFTLFWMFYHDYKNKRLANDYNLFFYGIAFFILITAALTAAGRLRFGVVQAMSSRYTTPALIYWTSIFILAFTHWPRLVKRLGYLLLGVLMYFCVLQKIIFSQAPSAPQHRFELLSLLMKVSNKGQAFLGCPPELFQDEKIKKLVDNKICPFDEAWTKNVFYGYKPTIEVIASGTLHGYIDSLNGYSKNYQVIHGHLTTDPWPKCIPEFITFMNSRHEVVGYGFNKFTIKSQMTTAFTGYIHRDTTKDNIAYALLEANNGMKKWITF